MLVREYMTEKVFTVRVDKRLFVARQIIEWAHIRHVPVLDMAGQIVGMISHRDLLRASISSAASGVARIEKNQHLSGISIEEIMQKNVMTISADATVQEAARLMREYKVGCLPVLLQGQLVGIITEHDLLRVVANFQN